MSWNISLKSARVKIVSDNSMRGNSMSFRAIVNLHPKKDGKINMWNGSIDERLPPHSRKPYHLLVHPTIIHVFHHPECQKGFPNAPIWEASYKYIYIYDVIWLIIYIYVVYTTHFWWGWFFIWFTTLRRYATNTSWDAARSSWPAKVTKTSRLSTTDSTTGSTGWNIYPLVI